MVEKDDKKNKIKKKLTKEDYISIIIGCFITFFIANLLVRFMEKSYIIFNIYNISLLIGEAFVSTILAITITLFSRLSIVGIGIIAFFAIRGRLYLIFRDIYNMSPLTSSAYATYIFLLITIFGVAACWTIKKLLTKR